MLNWAFPFRKKNKRFNEMKVTQPKGVVMINLTNISAVARKVAPFVVGAASAFVAQKAVSKVKNDTPPALEVVK
jgi:hypothetical protein